MDSPIQRGQDLTNEDLNRILRLAKKHNHDLRSAIKELEDRRTEMQHQQGQARDDPSQQQQQQDMCDCEPPQRQDSKTVASEDDNDNEDNLIHLCLSKPDYDTIMSTISSDMNFIVQYHTTLRSMGRPPTMTESLLLGRLIGFSQRVRKAFEIPAVEAWREACAGFGTAT